MDVSMQSKGRVEKYMEMDIEALRNVIGMKIENPQIFKEFMSAETPTEEGEEGGAEPINWDYAVAAGILTRADVKYIKEEFHSEPLESGTVSVIPGENYGQPTL